MLRTSFRHLRKQLLGDTNRSRPAGRKPRWVRPRLEVLEARELLTASHLIGGGLVGDPGPTDVYDAGSQVLTQGEVSQPYSFAVTGFGTDRTNLQSVAGLPAGLHVGKSGTTLTFSGTPTQSGTFEVFVTATEGKSTEYDGTYFLTVNPLLSLGSLSATAWTAGQAGSAAIPVIGGIPAYSHLAVTGRPAGLSAVLSGNAITVSGTPSGAGTYSNVAVSLQDSLGVTARHTYSLIVNLAVGPNSLPADRAGQGYSATITATGGSGHYAFALASGALPAGMSLSSAGVLSGRPTVAGTYTFTVLTTDSLNPFTSGSRAYTLTVNAGPASQFYFAPLPASTVAGKPFNVTIKAEDDYGNVDPTYNDKAALTASGGQNVSPNVVTLTGGVFSGNVTLAVPGTVRLIANWAAISGTSGTILVKPPPAIYGLSTLIGYAPGYSAQYLQTGSSVTITGYGFAPGTKVRFNGWAGDSYLLATPTSIAADGTSLTVNVPPFAQTGPLVVKIPDGTALQSSQTFTVRDYRNTYGFSFKNFTDFNITEGLIDDEYGSPVSTGDVIVGAGIGFLFGGPGGAVAGAGTASGADAALSGAYLAFCAGLLNGKGACFGMVLTTIQMENNPGLINATNGLPSGAAATVFNLQPTGDGPASQALRRTIEKNHLAQFSAEELHYAVGWAADSVLGNHSSQAIYDQINGLLQSGQHPIIGLRGGANHAVAAYDLEPPDGSGVYYIDVYDPNRPYTPGGDGTQATDSRIKIDPNRGWSFTMADGTFCSGGFNDTPLPSIMVTPPSVVAGHVTKPTTLDGLEKVIVGNTAAPVTSPAAGAPDSYWATLVEQPLTASALMTVSRPVHPGLPRTSSEPPHAAAIPGPATAGSQGAQRLGSIVGASDMAFSDLDSLSHGREELCVLGRK